MSHSHVYTLVNVIYEIDSFSLDPGQFYIRQREVESYRDRIIKAYSFPRIFILNDLVKACSAFNFDGARTTPTEYILVAENRRLRIQLKEAKDALGIAKYNKNIFTVYHIEFPNSIFEYSFQRSFSTLKLHNKYVVEAKVGNRELMRK